MVRIIAGSRRGTRLQVPKGLNVRPTADRIKETIFNILGSEILDARVLDLFAGSGALGLEALSRGASHAILVDVDRASLAAIRSNIEKTGFSHCTQVVRARLPNLSFLNSDHDDFDLIFLDPPYSRNLVGSTLSALDEICPLSEGGTVIVEHSSMEDLPSGLKNLKPFREKNFGEGRITFLKSQ